MIEISAGDFQMHIAPRHGGVVTRLEWRGRQILRGPAEQSAIQTTPLESACYPCAPWFGRLTGALDFAGHKWTPTPNHPICDPDYAIHGYAWLGRWRVVDCTSNRAHIRFDFCSQGDDFPFAFSTHQIFEVRPDCVLTSLTLVNRNDHAMPAGLALHPFFFRSPTTRLSFAAERAYALPEEANKSSKRGLENLNFENPSNLPEHTTDISFTRFGGEACIRQPEFQIRLISDAPYLHLYAPANENFFCVEPTTQLPGRFGKTTSLDQGETLSLSMRLSAS